MASKKLLEEIASKITDYRKSEIDVLDADHVNRWISQFRTDVRDPILHEMNHVLERTYVNRRAVNQFLKGISSHEQLTSGKPKKFWKETTVLDIQRAGSSQRELRQIFREIVQKEHGMDINEGPADSNTAIYLDDVVFTGGHVGGDLVRWIEGPAPAKVTVHVIVLAFHSGGQWFAGEKIKKAAANVSKVLKLNWWRISEIEDRKRYIDGSDVLRPTVIPDHGPTKAYVQMLTDLGFPPVLRRPGSVGNAKFYSSEEGRNLLEQEFLTAGVEIRQMCPYLNDNQRPLGLMVLKTLGFGALLATFRNCANNCPLALWAGDPWHPLFPRKINTP